MSRRMPIAANELAGIAEAAGALGVAKKDILGFTEVVAQLGVTTDLTSEGAATSLGHLRTTLGLSGKDFERFGNSLVDLGNNGASTESQILGMAEAVAGASKIVGLSTDETLGWASALANTGEQVEAGGSSLQKFFLNSFKAVNKGGKALRVYAKTAGMSGAAFKRTMDKDFSGAMETFLVGLGKLDKPQQLQVLDDLGFTDIRITRALLKLTGNTRNLTDSLDTSRKAWRRNNAMTEEADKRFGTFASRVQVLKNNLMGLGVTVGNAVLPHLSKLVKRVNEWLADPEQQKAVEAFATDLSKGFGELVAKAEEFAGTVDWGQVVKDVRAAVSLTGQVVGKAIEIFNSAPPWLKTAIVTGWGLNKLTGGAFGSIVAELGKGLVKGVLGMNACVVNLTAGSIRGGTGAGPAGARGSVVAGAVGGILTVALAAGSIYALGEVWKQVMTDVGFTQQETNKRIERFAARDVSAPGGTLALSTLTRDIRASLETGNVLLDVANKLALGAGAQEQFDSAILAAAQKILDDKHASVPQLLAGLQAIEDVQQLTADHGGLTAASSARLEAIGAGVRTKLGQVYSGIAPIAGITRDVASAVRAQELSVVTNVAFSPSLTVSGRDVAIESEKLRIRSGRSSDQ